MFSITNLSTETREDFKNEILCIADSKWALAAWYERALPSAGSIGDMNTMAAVTQVVYGHVRALFQYLGDFQLAYDHLQHKRETSEIHSMGMLSKPPQSWADFIVCQYLAESAIWTLSSGFLGGPDHVLNGLVKKMGEEVYFHLLYAEGWIEELSQTKKSEIEQSFAERLPAALQWIGPPDQGDSLCDVCLRVTPMGTLRENFISHVSPHAGAAIDTAESLSYEGWDKGFRRIGNDPISDRLHNIMRFRDPHLAME